MKCGPFTFQGLLRLQTQVNHVRKLLNQHLNHRAASLLVKVVLDFVELHFHKASPRLTNLCRCSKTQVMFDFTLSLQPVIQFMTLLPSLCLEELVSTFADEVGNTFDETATRVRAIVHLVQYPTSGNLSDSSHNQIASFVLNNTDGYSNVSNHVSSEYLPASPAQPDGSTARDFSNSFIKEAAAGSHAAGAFKCFLSARAYSIDGSIRAMNFSRVVAGDP